MAFITAKFDVARKSQELNELLAKLGATLSDSKTIDEVIREETKKIIDDTALEFQDSVHSYLFAYVEHNLSSREFIQKAGSFPESTYPRFDYAFSEKVKKIFIRMKNIYDLGEINNYSFKLDNRPPKTTSKTHRRSYGRF